LTSLFFKTIQSLKGYFLAMAMAMAIAVTPQPPPFI
jgi:hypothetical protein